MKIRSPYETTHWDHRKEESCENTSTVAGQIVSSMCAPSTAARTPANGKQRAGYQSGGNLTEVKRQVDTILLSLNGELNGNKATQVEKWTALLTELEGYLNCKAHPGWETVIANPRMSIKSRKRSALGYWRHIRKHRMQQEKHQAG